MAWHAGKEVVDGLELQAAVEEVEPLGAGDIHGGAQLALGEGLGGAEVGGGHAPVGEGDLDVEEHGDAVRDENEADAGRPVGEGAPEQAVAKDGPEARHEGHLEVAGPPGGAELRGARREQVRPREEVEVEAGDAHDGVISVLLPGHEHVGGLVPNEAELVEGAVDGLEVGGASGKEGHVLVVGIVLWHVGDQVVHVVGALPPANREAVAKVGHKGPNDGIDDEVAGDAAVARVMGDKHDLLLERGGRKGMLVPCHAYSYVHHSTIHCVDELEGEEGGGGNSK